MVRYWVAAAWEKFQKDGKPKKPARAINGRSQTPPRASRNPPQLPAEASAAFGKSGFPNGLSCRDAYSKMNLRSASETTRSNPHDRRDQPPRQQREKRAEVFLRSRRPAGTSA